MYSIDIREFRRANKMTQQELADYFGVVQGFISSMENGREKVPDKYISKILGDPNVDSSMVKVVALENEVKMPR
ncbi:helix-turn-helix domain-containing protein, partial [Alistipes putredinis]|uniref:helix-turn-helix domain-containing protein n=1 Tax=Alistipes putredinis TaxID=28117 RepID=UPI003AB84DFF